jgi:hypothetical protein
VNGAIFVEIVQRHLVSILVWSLCLKKRQLGHARNENTMMKRATKLAEIPHSCDPRPLNASELAEFFVSTDDARDPHIGRREQLRKLLQTNASGLKKIVLAGHSGAGKSTELVKLIQELGSSFFCVSFSVAQECNLAHILVEDMLVAIMERLVNKCQSDGLGERFAVTRAMKEIYDWFAKELQIDNQSDEKSVELEVGADTSQTWIGKLLGLLVKAKVSNRQKDESATRREREVPHRLPNLTERCNLLIREVRQVLEPDRKLLVLIEDLDKASLNDTRKIFVDQPTILADLQTNLVATIPIFLLHSPDADRFRCLFETIVLPMVKIHEVDQSPYQAGLEVLRDVIGRRVKDGLIAEDAMKLLLEKTGGVLRDIFEVIVHASHVAESQFELQKQPLALITSENIRYALNRRKSEYARAISVINLPTEWKLTSELLWSRLKALSEKPRPQLDGDYDDMVLLQAKAVLEYNGEQWFAVHPLVKELVESRGT